MLSGVPVWNKVFHYYLIRVPQIASKYVNEMKTNENVRGEIMNTLGKLESLFPSGDITEEEYKERKEAYIETILELYVLGIITKEQMQEKLNQ